MRQFIAKLLLSILSVLLLSLEPQAQLTQTLRGRVVDQLLQKPLAGATVSVTGMPGSALTSDDGSFKIVGIPVGSRQITVTYIGYKSVTLDNIVVNSGKEASVDVAMEADAELQQQVQIVAKSKKNRPINDMSVVSARAFTVEETQKFAAAVNDPLRMATSFAGVVSADDGNNEIVIRGNSPTGLLWRMEGVDIPNPNHFSSAGSSGGGISILSAQLLANSDFVTGAFSAEYGNAISGVFDLRLRKGNNEKREYTAQAGLLGLNFAAEGPFASGYKGSYLVNYRYSTLQLLSKLGLDVGDGGVTNFQDLSFNIYLPTSRKGDFTIFGFGGLSDQTNKPEKDSSKWENEGDRYGGTFTANTSAVGATHSIALGTNTHLKSSVALSYTRNDYNELYLDNNETNLNTFNNKYKTRKWTFNSTANQRINNRINLRSGIIANLINYNYYQKSRENPGEPIVERINNSDNTATLQAFSQAQIKVTNRLSIQAGLHYLYLLLNKTNSLEPRASARYELNNRNSIAFGYGRHSQIQPLGVYFAKTMSPDGEIVMPNKNLSFTKADHYVLSYGYAISSTMRFKAELYYQHLTNVPVSIYDSISFSTLNIRGDFETDALVNSGTGKNYGIDLTLEKQLNRNFYFILNQSFYQSKYRASDGIERDTGFNGNNVTNFTGGKEFVLAAGRRTFGINLKMIYAGGFRTTPIDIPLSIEKGYTVFIENEAFSLQNPAYFRTDLRLSMKWNKKHITSTLSLDIQNLTNRQNIYNQQFDPFKGEVINIYQTGLIPVLNYKIDF